MTAQGSNLIGRRLPETRLGELVGGEIHTLVASELFAQGRTVIVGMPGAFTPICSGRHLPNLIENAARLRMGGVKHLACIVTSDPFTMDAWARQSDPEGQIRFLSDGNLEFARDLGLTSFEPSLFLGERSARYLLLVQDGVITTARFERSILDVECTIVSALDL